MHVRDFLQTVTINDTYTDNTRSCRIMKSQRQRYRYRFQDIVLFSTSSPILQRAMCKKWKEKFLRIFPSDL